MLMGGGGHTILGHLLAGTKVTLAQRLGRPGGPSPGHAGALTWGWWLGGQQRLGVGSQGGSGPRPQTWLWAWPMSRGQRGLCGFPRLGAPDFVPLSGLRRQPPPPLNYLWELKLLSHRFPGLASGAPHLQRPLLEPRSVHRPPSPAPSPAALGSAAAAEHPLLDRGGPA